MRYSDKPGYIVNVLIALFAPLMAGCELADGGIFLSGPTVYGEFRKADAVPDNVVVEVRNGSGNTLVFGTSDRQVSVEGKIRVRARGKDQADKIVAEFVKNPPVRFEGSRVVIGQVEKSDFEAANISVDFIIAMPRTGSLNSRTGSGDQELRDLSGDVDAVTGSGDTKVTNIDGSLHAKAGSGDITVRDVRGEARMTAGSGDIAAENMGGRVEMSTGSGDIRIAYANRELQAHASSGTIRVHEAKSVLRLRTSSGDIEVESLLLPGSSWDLESASGDIDVLLPSASQFNLDANTHNGEVFSDFNVAAAEGGSNKGILRGTVGKGSDWIRISSNSGRIRVRKN